MELLCKIRDLYRAITVFESRFENCHGLSLNEGMLLCTLYKNTKLTSGQLSDSLGLSLSNTSKVIKEVEEKELVIRRLGDTDKRHMYFSLTEAGRKKLETITQQDVEIPDLLKMYL